tara:strand:+ start:22266 stop:23144 length:879 start_codon:yes stop_codon:yes gene_type:complete
MAKLTENDFTEVLEALLPKDDEVVAIYSGLWTFAGGFGWPPDQMGERVLRLVEDFLGPDRTFVLPAYSFLDFARFRRFDLVRTMTETGALPDAALACYAAGDRGWMRSRSAMNSYLVRGPRSADLLARPCTTAWGADGVLGWLCEVNARVCVLGVPWVSCSMMHHAEELQMVPYRYFKRFAGTLFKDGQEIGPCVEVMYSRSLHAVPEWDITGFGAELRAQGAVEVSDNRRIPMESGPAREVHRVNSELFAADPYCYITNKDVLESWIANGKEAEVAGLKPKERWPQPAAAD